MNKFDFVAQTTLQEFASKKKHTIAISDSSSLGDALKKMKEDNVTCLPIFHKEHKTAIDAFKKLWEKKEEKVFVGIISMFEIMAYVTGFSYTDLKIKELTVEDFEADVKKRMEQPIVDLLDMSSESQTLWEYDASQKLESIMHPLSVGVHRFLVHDHEKKHSFLLTQTDIVKHFLANVDEMPTVSSTAISELGLYKTSDSVITMDSSKTALHAYLIMVQNKLNALPIVDSAGSLVGTLSANDLKNLPRKHYSSLMKDVVDFLKECKWQANISFTCQPSDSLKAVMHRMVEYHVHRLWVEVETKPVGVVSMTDIITKFSPS